MNERGRIDGALGFRQIAIVCVCALATALAAACHRDAPVVNAPAAAITTMSGFVHGPEGAAPVKGRPVEVVSLATGRVRRTRTSPNGVFTIELPPGKYRVNVVLLDGERLLERPDVVELDPGDLDARVELVVGTARSLRPTGPAYRLDNGLGSPSA